ncbi:two-component sensor histidine kinase, partial [Mycobacterium sp. ITM-2017-0098]
MTRTWQSWPLLRQLVVGVCAVVMLALVTVGTMSVVTLRASVLGILDGQLAGAADGYEKSVAKYRSSPGPGGTLPAPTTMKPLIHLVGQAPGNVVALIQRGDVVDSALFLDGEARA